MRRASVAAGSSGVIVWVEEGRSMRGSRSGPIERPTDRPKRECMQTARGVRFDGSLAERLLGGYTPTEATIVDSADSFIALGLADPIRSSSSALIAGATAGVAVAVVAAVAMLSYRVASIKS